MTDKTRIVTLDNGAVIVARKFPDSQTAHVQWSISAGSYAERADEHGVAHFLEHTLVNPEIVYQPIKRRGADVNAYTSYENIAMWARVMPEHVADTQQRIFEHGLIKPAITQADFDREFGPIKMEITNRLADADLRLHVKANAVMFAGEPRAHFITGTHADMDTHNLGKLRSFFARTSAPRGTVALVAGKFDQRAFFRTAEKLLRDLPDTPVETSVPGHFRPGEAIFVEPPSSADLSPNEQEVKLIARFKAVSSTSSQRVAFSILCTMLSDGMDSPLMVELRHKRGLVYGVGAGLELWGNDGNVQVSLDTSRQNIEQATQVLATSLAQASTYLTQDRFQRAHDTMRFAFADASESSKGWAQRAVNDLRLFGRIRERSELMALYDAVTLDDVRKAALTAFTQPAFVAAMGPVEGLSFKPVFDKAMKLTA